jgi:16S rRNA (guanine966-N2)-methyltransferase
VTTRRSAAGAGRGPGLRVIAGELRGRRLRAPAGRATRPTSDRVREAAFGLLGPGSCRGRVLDLYAGSGALGIEALSRGAVHATFLERSRDALRVLRGNLTDLGLEERARVLPGGVSAGLDRLAGEPARYDLAFADPPYGTEDLAALATRVAGLLVPGGDFVLERAAGETAPLVSGLALRKDRRYGDTGITLYRCDPEERP